ncbi:hypothetical protein [Sneathiella litorea]|uniref:Uncharacterized protein n=1 Tax=Sneathiella litorea TaxID=2606216 RepID=A0A6L8W3I1_9PROT|nr:hypothetical protein [Sneathiella litorea]MZR29656.1 hypothetical protein [Sneathiella litorea]
MADPSPTLGAPATVWAAHSTSGIRGLNLRFSWHMVRLRHGRPGWPLQETLDWIEACNAECEAIAA